MKFIHLADLHIGKSIDRLRLLEDQGYILEELYKIICAEQPDAVLISGDVYDRGVPPVEAVELLDKFITRLALLKNADGQPMQTFIISGNHDSAERLAFGNSLLSKNGIHISPLYNGNIEPFVMQDKWGSVNIYMLPFIKPAHVNNALYDRRTDGEEQERVSDYTEAAAKAIEMMNVDPDQRNVLLSHQFVGGAETSDSEVRSVGGIDMVDSSVYSDFNYVALGHLHKPQRISTPGGDRNVLYYCGSPLKYSFSETTQKSAAVVEIDGGGCVSLRKIPLVPLRDMRTIEGSFEEITSNAKKSDKTEDYIRIKLTDTQLPTHAYYELRRLFPQLVTTVTSEVRRERVDLGSNVTEEQSKLEIFTQFFIYMNGREPDSAELEYMISLVERAEEAVSGRKE